MLDRVIDLTVPNETVEMNDAAGLILLLRMVLGIELADRARIFDELVADLEVGG